MDADKKKFDMFLFVQKSLFLWDRCRRAKLILATDSLATLYQFYVINEIRRQTKLQFPFLFFTFFIINLKSLPKVWL